MKRDWAFFNAAKEIANLSDFRRIHIGCVVVSKNRIISSGCNTTKTNPLQKKYNAVRFTEDGNHGCHAETSALLPLLKEGSFDGAHSKIYLYREHADGSLALSRPCASCMKMLQDAGIRHIYYTTENGYAEEILRE